MDAAENSDSGGAAMKWRHTPPNEWVLESDAEVTLTIVRLEVEEAAPWFRVQREGFGLHADFATLEEAKNAAEASLGRS